MVDVSEIKENKPCGSKSSVSNYRDNCVPENQYIKYYRFNKEQYYYGDFFRDSLHGQGSYKWGDETAYEGGFYANRKEGYGVVSFRDNSNFEGLFVMNKPFGPGIWTYANGRQDAGFWMGKKLVRLGRAVDFIIPRLASTPAGKIKLLQFRRLIPLDEITWNLDMKSGTDILQKCGYPFEHFYSPYSRLIYDPKSMFFDTLVFEKTYFKNYKKLIVEFEGSSKEWSFRQSGGSELEEKKNYDTYRENLVPDGVTPCTQELLRFYNDYDSDFCDELSNDKDKELGILGLFTKFGTIDGNDEEGLFDEDLQGEAEEEEEKSEISQIVAWNRNDICVEMLKQIFRYRAFEEKLNFDLAKLMMGTRTAFRKTGLKEKECLEFLKLCSTGPAQAVKSFLCNYEISEELMDGRGNNSLMFAAAADQHEIIDVLLGYGVEVNTFNDENLTPLNLCLLRRLALENMIFCWEVAFLPKEIEGTEYYAQSQPWQIQESISSLDRIFGDGMSINESKICVLTTGTHSSIPKADKSGEQIQSPKSSNSIQNIKLSNTSQISVQNITKKPGERSLTQMNHNKSQNGLRTSLSDNEIRDNKKKSSERTFDNCKTVESKFPKREEFQRSIRRTSNDRYMFEFNFDSNPNRRVTKTQRSFEKMNPDEKQSSKELEEEENEERDAWFFLKDIDFELGNKIAEVDKTIEQLLSRGANPNISEVPKPSIHLGIYTKNLNIVHALLFYGANPNSQLYPNEGLLTPLHVIVLQDAAPEYVEICKLLLLFGGDPNNKTSPEFYINEDEGDLLDPETGRNPLQLLCMRPDLEVADPNDYLIKIGLLLLEKTNKKSTYNGHSYLTLAMLNCNIKLLKALLRSKLFDPNETLEKDKGTALHVLVSRELQKKNYYPGSIEMCDLLLENGADPLKTFKKPKSLVGNCVDYGYREIEAERESRKSSNGNNNLKTGRKSQEGKISKEKNEDYLQDHIKVVEYLEKRISEMSAKEKGKKTPDSNTKKQQQKETPGKTGKDKKGKEEKTITEETTKQTETNKKEEGKGKNKEKEEQKGKDKEKKDQKEKNTQKEEQKPQKQTDDKDKLKTTKKEDNKTEPKNKTTDNKKSTKKQSDENKNTTNNQPPKKDKKPNSFPKVTNPCSETFPEKIRQSLLKVYGHCITLDVNELLVPYVVLRDGDLYYKFKGNTKSHEQYSLI